MFEKQRNMIIKAKIDDVWDFLLKYEWSDLMVGDRVTKVSSCEWSIQNGQGEHINIQDIEVEFLKDIYQINIKISPRYNKHHSYDRLSVLLEKQQCTTLVTLTYEPHLHSFTEKMFAIIVDREEKIFTEYAEELFNAINKFLLKSMYG